MTMKFLPRWSSLFFAALATLSVVSAKDPCFGATDDAAYLAWVNSENAQFYNASVCYNATSGVITDGIALHWKIDDENLYLAVAARATGWVGFGIAETSGMLGSDLVLFEVAKPGVLRDAHVLEVRNPIDDDCQDWVFKNSTVDGGFIIFEGYRKLDTLDSQDRAILEDSDTVIPPQRILAAWGDDKVVGYHGLNRAQGSLRWYSGGDELDLVHQKLMEQADGYFDLLVPNFTLAAKATDYVAFCFSWEKDLVPQGLPLDGTIQVIAAEVIFDAESKPYVHHADVSASTIPSNQSRTCLPEGSYGYSVYSWAPGILPFVMPDNVGYLMGPGAGGDEEGGLQSFRLNIHYNNPDLIEGIVDRGGLRVYYSNTIREHELGIMALGDSLTKLEGVPIPAGITQYEFGCIPGCSKLGLDEPVTVIQEMIHMHIDGYAAETFHIRDDAVIRGSRIDYFDFNQAGLPVIRQKPFTVNPGDSFVSTFYFNSDNGTHFGLGSYEEMSKHVLLYYPAKKIYGYPWSCTYDVPLAVCNASMSSRILSPNEQPDRWFGPAPGQCSEKAVLKTSTTSAASSVRFACGAVIVGTMMMLVTML